MSFENNENRKGKEKLITLKPSGGDGCWAKAASSAAMRLHHNCKTACHWRANARGRENNVVFADVLARSAHPSPSHGPACASRAPFALWPAAAVDQVRVQGKGDAARCVSSAE